MLSASTMKINLSDFEPVAAEKRENRCFITVRPSGFVVLNKKLINEISSRTDKLNFGFYCHKQSKDILLLTLTDNPNYSFPASGIRKDTLFSQSLVENGIMLPARYSVEWNAGASAWVGVLKGKHVKDSLSASLKAGQTTRRKIV